jgi:hypothetical protein
MCESASGESLPDWIGETRRRVPSCGLSRRQEGEMLGGMPCMQVTMWCHEGETGNFCLCRVEDRSQ